MKSKKKEKIMLELHKVFADHMPNDDLYSVVGMIECFKLQIVNCTFMDINIEMLKGEKNEYKSK